MNLVLLGYRGAGKSTVGRILARSLRMPLVSLDAEIVRLAGKRIPEIVAESGWGAFRDLESSVVDLYGAKDGWILDAGGGVVVRASNVELLRRRGILIWLRVSPSSVVDRIRSDTERPALKEGKTFLEEVEEVLAERTPLYAAAADFTVETDGRLPDLVAAEILDRLKRADLRRARPSAGPGTPRFVIRGCSS